MDKIQICIELLQKDGYIDSNLSLKEAYEKVIGIYNLERTAPEMWKMVWEHKILSLFQMEKASGINGIDTIHPKSVDELAVLNSVIRLMSDEGETPLEKWARYRNDITIWHKEMKEYGLTKDEIEWLSRHSAVTDGICESQEGLMSLVREERLGGNSLNFADKCRKGLAKKIGSLFDECEQEYYKNAKAKNCSQKLVEYVWQVLLSVQRGYSFNRSHTLAYSLVGLQEMNLAYHYPIIYWNCANLIVNAGGEEGNDGQTDYNKMARALSETIKAGIKLSLVNINQSDYGFKPDPENNQILYGMKAMLNVGEDVIEATIQNRPYTSPKDFFIRVKPKKQAMISLIKGGAFDSLMDRKLCMGWYIWETCDKKKRLTLQNMSALIKYNLLPHENDQQKTARRVYEFNRYLKAVCKIKEDPNHYQLDDRGINFLTELGEDYLFNNFLLSVKAWDKVYQNWMDIYRDWMSQNKEQILQNLNMAIFKEEWDKYAQGTISAWEMEALCFYYHDHELAHLNNNKYGFVNFYNLPEDPEVESTFKRGNKEINIFKLHKICGTCIAKDKTKSTVSLLTPSGVVNVKFRKEYFSLFDKQISEKGADGVKHIVEKSWFNRGSMIVVLGIRSGDDFISKKYNSSNSHQLYKITSIDNQGSLILQDARYQGGVMEDDV